jgi:hypothetical protein
LLQGFSMQATTRDSAAAALPSGPSSITSS